MDFGPGQEEEEAHFGDVVLSLAEYAMDAEQEVRRREHALTLLPPGDYSILQPLVQPRLSRQRECYRVNQDFFNLVHQPFARNIDKRFRELTSNNNTQQSSILSTEHNLSKARSTLHQVYREWSEEGREERDQCFGVIASTLMKHYQKQNTNQQQPWLVAVPGCGLNRLCVDLARLNNNNNSFIIEGSEFSYQMLLVGDFILHRIDKPNSLEVFPWIDQASNLANSQHVWQGTRFPDYAVAASADISDRIHIVAGEFSRLYSTPDQESRFDCTVFSYFIDTSSNVCEYLRVVRHMLKPGGLFITLGPLQWHWQPPHGQRGTAAGDARFAESVELTLEEVKQVMQQLGFRILFHEQVPGLSYSKFPRSMSRALYDCALIVAVNGK